MRSILPALLGAGALVLLPCASLKGDEAVKFTLTSTAFEAQVKGLAAPLDLVRVRLEDPAGDDEPTH